MPYKNQFEQDVIEGLQQPQKQLSSKYFYDETGDKLFQQIMNLEEYYLPESELEILKTRTADIAKHIEVDKFDVLELGAGDGRKVVYFLEELTRLGKEVTYYPFDISSDVLKTNMANVKDKLPYLEINPIAGDYSKTLPAFAINTPKVILFLGSNIGNYNDERAIEFLRWIRSNMQVDDILLMGVDLRKNPKTILKAYNDSQGVTKAFNLNVLHRINRELGGNFDVDAFDHYPFYDPISGITYSYLVSLKAQVVQIGEHKIPFKKDELLHTEVSQKYSLEEIENMQKETGFHSVQHFLDSKSYFSISLFSQVSE